jgi:hypothetical protein
MECRGRNNPRVPEKALQERKTKRGETFREHKVSVAGGGRGAGMSLCGAVQAHGQAKLIAKGTLTESGAGLYADLSGLDYNLENGAPANLLGGMGSALTWGYGDTFLSLPKPEPERWTYRTWMEQRPRRMP